MKSLLFTSLFVFGCISDPVQKRENLGYFTTYAMNADTLFLRGIELDLSKTPYQVKSINSKRLYITNWKSRSWTKTTPYFMSGSEQLWRDADGCFYTFTGIGSGIACLDGIQYYIEL